MGHPIYREVLIFYASRRIVSTSVKQARIYLWIFFIFRVVCSSSGLELIPGNTVCTWRVCMFSPYLVIGKRKTDDKLWYMCFNYPKRNMENLYRLFAKGNRAWDERRERSKCVLQLKWQTLNLRSTLQQSCTLTISEIKGKICIHETNEKPFPSQDYRSHNLRRSSSVHMRIRKHLSESLKVPWEMNERSFCTEPEEDTHSSHIKGSGEWDLALWWSCLR